MEGRQLDVNGAEKGDKKTQDAELHFKQIKRK